MSNDTDYNGSEGGNLTVREWADGKVSVIVSGTTVSNGIESFTFASADDVAGLARTAARIAGIKLAEEEDLPTVHVERDGVYAGDGDSRVRAGLEADVDWLRNRAGELFEQIEHLTAQYRNTLAVERWRQGVIAEEVDSLARSYFGPDLDGLPAGAREIVRDLRLARNRIAELTKPRPR